MRITKFPFSFVKLSVLRLLSSVVLLWALLIGTAQAHEIVPAIVDMTRVDDRLVFEMEANLESFVAGIDLSTVSDTDEAPRAATYDELRALEPVVMESRFRAFWPNMVDAMTLMADGEPLRVQLDTVEIGPVGNIEAVRPSSIQFSAPLPAGAETVTFGWAQEYGALVLRQMDVPEPYDGYLDQGALSDPINLAGGNQASGWETFVDYIPVGFDHIVPKGLDHILFVLGLFFLAARLRPLILQVSLFTVAHTITLALAALGYTRSIEDAFLNTFNFEFITAVEVLIALSIVYVAVENIFFSRISPWRPIVIFVFGLLHGLGFASVLAEFGLPDSSFVPALIGFNVGVEVGQLFVIAVMFLCVWQALRIDRGANEVNQGFAVYAVLLIIALALMALEPAALVTILENPVWLFAGPLAAVFILCIASIQFRDRLDAYRQFVAIPASIAIAFVGAYWVYERIFL
ncbi:HupE/UreJ family protein [Yoonia sp. 2307UL14-13]|uniref:HupE/UreJ family protein n=1 Tax=Yoonia sp. 2307UL14-13 TaxID=3126506 RepID=UPI0030A81BAD